MSELSPEGGSEGYGVCSDVMACAAGRSAVQVVPRTAGILLSKCGSLVFLAVSLV